MGISYIDAKTDLVMNKMTREIYEELKLSGLIKDDELYFITDDAPITSTISSYLSSYYKKSETSSNLELSDEFKKYQLSGNYLLSSNLSFNYDSETKFIYLKAFNNNLIGEVNCADFIKDGMLSTVSLSGNTLVFVFNTDAGKTPISVNLSSFVDNYDAKIEYLSNAISTDVKNLADNYYKKSETSSSTEISDALSTIQDNIDNKIKTGTYANSTYDLKNSNLSVIKLSEIDYHQLVSEGKILSDAIYMTSSDNLNAFDNTIINVAEPTLSNDAATKNYVDNISGNLFDKIPTKTSQLSNDSNFLSAHQSLTAYETISDLTANYYKKSETSSSTEISDTLNVISNEIDAKVKIGNYENQAYNLATSYLSVIKISEFDYNHLVQTSTLISNALYVISSDNIDAHNEKIVNVATPSSDSDAVNKLYVDNILTSYTTFEQVSAIVSVMINNTLTTQF